MQTGSERKLPIALLIAMAGFPQISETIYTPALPGVAAGLSTTAHMVEASLSIYFLGFALGVLFWGSISDWSGRRMAMLWGLVIYGIGTFLCGNSGSVQELLVWRCVQAFGASVGSIITQTVIRDACSEGRRTRIFSLLTGSLAFSPAIGPILGGFLSEYAGWRANFWVLTLLSVGLIFWSFLSLPETRPAKTSAVDWVDIRRLLGSMGRSRLLWGHIFLISATNGILFSFYQEAPFIFIEQMGIRPTIYGLLGLLVAAATIVSARFSYLYQKNTSPERMIQWGAAAAMVGSLLWTFATSAGMIRPHGIEMTITLCDLFAIFFGIGLVIPNSLSLALKPYRFAIGTAGSLFSGCYYCLIACFTLLMSLLHDGTVCPLPFYMTALSILLVVAARMVNSSTAKQLQNWDLGEANCLAPDIQQKL